jgi:hypothetical protein
MALIDDVKKNLRITNTVHDTEIADLILSAKADMGLSGLLSEHVLDTDALIKRGIILYCKANFGLDNTDSEKYQKSYEMLRNHMSLSADYSFYTVTFTITDSVTDAAIRQAEVGLAGEFKETDENGVAVFYVRAGNNYKYYVIAEGYISDDDDDNLIDITANETVDIALVGV